MACAAAVALPLLIKKNYHETEVSHHTTNCRQKVSRNTTNVQIDT
jgi:hypothetical protein